MKSILLNVSIGVWIEVPDGYQEEIDSSILNIKVNSYDSDVKVTNTFTVDSLIVEDDRDEL